MLWVVITYLWPRYLLLASKLSYISRVSCKLQYHYVISNSLVLEISQLQYWRHQSFALNPQHFVYVIPIPTYTGSFAASQDAASTLFGILREWGILEELGVGAKCYHLTQERDWLLTHCMGIANVGTDHLLEWFLHTLQRKKKKKRLMNFSWVNVDQVSWHPWRTSRPKSVNTLRPRQNGRHFADAIFKCIFLNENVWIPIKISLKFVPQGPLSNIPALVQIMG